MLCRGADGAVSGRVGIVGKVERVEVVLIAARLRVIPLARQRAEVTRNEIACADAEVVPTVASRVPESGPLRSLVDTRLRTHVPRHRVRGEAVCQRLDETAGRNVGRGGVTADIVRLGILPDKLGGLVIDVLLILACGRGKTG